MCPPLSQSLPQARIVNPFFLIHHTLGEKLGRTGQRGIIGGPLVRQGSIELEEIPDPGRVSTSDRLLRNRMSPPEHPSRDTFYSQVRRGNVQEEEPKLIAEGAEPDDSR